MLVEQDFIAAGYGRFKQPNLNQSDFGLQKCIRDDRGKKYYITVWVYDWSKYQGIYTTRPMSFEPDLHFKLPCGLHMNFQLLLDNNSTIECIENKVEEIWVKLGCLYYEEY
jgi:hypothetical protein